MNISSVLERLDKAWIQSGHMQALKPFMPVKPDIAQDLIKMSRQRVGEQVLGRKNTNGRDKP